MGDLLVWCRLRNSLLLWPREGEEAAVIWSVACTLVPLQPGLLMDVNLWGYHVVPLCKLVPLHPDSTSAQLATNGDAKMDGQDLKQHRWKPGSS